MLHLNLYLWRVKTRDVTMKFMSKPCYKTDRGVLLMDYVVYLTAISLSIKLEWIILPAKKTSATESSGVGA